MPTITLGPPFDGVQLGGNTGLITQANAVTGTAAIHNSVLFANDQTASVGFVATTPVLPSSTNPITVDAEWQLDGDIVAEAVPGYAIARIDGSLFIMGLPFRFPPDIHAGEVTLRFAEAGGLSALGGSFFGFSPGVTSVPFARTGRIRQYVVIATILSRAGCGGWAHAEATLFRAVLNSLTISF